MLLRNSLAYLITFFLFFLGCQSPKKQGDFDKFLEASKNEKTNLDKQLQAASKAYSIGLDQKSDSLQLKASMELLRIYLDKQDQIRLKKQAYKSIDLSIKVKDTFSRAKSYSYLGYNYLSQYKNDSAFYYYYNASKLYKGLKDSLNLGKSLLSMSIIEKDNSDFISSMTTTILAEKLIKPLKDNERLLASIYNELGIATNELGHYQQSLSYHNKALKYRKLINNPALELESINNIGIVYKNQKKLNLAITYFKKALAIDSILSPKLKAILFDNLGHAFLMQSQRSKSKPLLESALQIRLKENELPGQVVSYIHLAEFYKDIHPKKTNQMLLEAVKVSKGLNANRDLLASYKILSLSNNSNKEYIAQYISLNDSIKKAEGNNINKFARIKYESDVLLDEKEKAITEILYRKQQISDRNYIISLLFIIIVLVGFLVFLLYKLSRFQKKLYHDFNHRTRNNLSHIQRGIIKLSKLDENSSQKLSQGIKQLDSTTNTQLLVLAMLEKSNYPKKIFLNLYLEDLINSLIRSYNEFNISVKSELIPSQVDPKTASVIGLIVNEFITNAFKYGFVLEDLNEFKMNSTLSISNQMTLNFMCSGKHWDTNEITKGSGILIMKSLAKEINAKFELYHHEQTVLVLTFAIPSKSFLLWKKLNF